VGWVGFGQSADGLGWVGSHDGPMDNSAGIREPTLTADICRIVLVHVGRQLYTLSKTTADMTYTYGRQHQQQTSGPRCMGLGYGRLSRFQIITGKTCKFNYLTNTVHSFFLLFHRVYETVERPSVCLSHRPTEAETCGFAAERPACRQEISIDIGHQRLAVQQWRRSTEHSSKCGQCRADSRGTRLKTDLFLFLI